MSKKISVILPTYNEKKNVIPLIREIHYVLGNFHHEIIVVDDHSPDGTYDALMELNDISLKVILRKEKRSLAESIRCGLQKALGDVFVIMDSDGQHQPKYLPQMIVEVAEYDCVVASRFLPGGGMSNPVRQWLSRLFNIFVCVMTKSRIRDNLYGFFVMKRQSLENCPEDKIFKGYGDYSLRLLYYLQKNKVKILELPVRDGKRFSGQGAKGFLRIFIKYFFAVIKLAYIARMNDRVSRD